MPDSFHAHLQRKESAIGTVFVGGWAMPDVDRYVHSMKGRVLNLSAMEDAAVFLVPMILPLFCQPWKW